MPNLQGYHDCACRDCFGIAIGVTAGGGPSLCWECKAHGCDATGGAECSCPGAYSSTCEECEGSGRTLRAQPCYCDAGREYAAGAAEWRADMLEGR